MSCVVCQAKTHSRALQAASRGFVDFVDFWREAKPSQARRKRQKSAKNGAGGLKPIGMVFVRVPFIFGHFEGVSSILLIFGEAARGQPAAGQPGQLKASQLKASLVLWCVCV